MPERVRHTSDRGTGGLPLVWRCSRSGWTWLCWEGGVVQRGAVLVTPGADSLGLTGVCSLEGPRRSRGRVQRGGHMSPGATITTTRPERSTARDPVTLNASGPRRWGGVVGQPVRLAASASCSGTAPPSSRSAPAGVVLVRRPTRPPGRSRRGARDQTGNHDSPVTGGGAGRRAGASSDRPAPYPPDQRAVRPLQVTSAVGRPRDALAVGKLLRSSAGPPGLSRL